MFKPVIYVICNKYEFLNFLVSRCYPIPQINCKLESLAVSLQRMTLLVNFKQTFVEKKLINVINTNKCKCKSLNIEMELPIYDGNEDQTQNYFETARALRYSNTCALKKYIFLYIPSA